MTPLEWYYEAIPLRTAWGQVPFFIAELPLIQPGSWLLFRIRSFPVPAQDDDHTVRLLVNDLALDTMSGMTIELSDRCFGHPLLCPAGPRWQETRCAATLVHASRETPAEMCTVLVEKRGPRSVIKSAGLNKLVLSTWGEKIVERCTGQGPIIHHVNKGTYIISVNDTCSISGLKWELRGIHLWESRRKISNDVFVEPPLLNLSQVTSDHHMGSLRFTTLAGADMRNLHLPKAIVPLQAPKWESSHATYWYIYVIAALSLISTCVGIFIWYKKYRTIPIKMKKLDSEATDSVIEAPGASDLYPKVKYVDGHLVTEYSPNVTLPTAPVTPAEGTPATPAENLGN